MPKKGRGRPQLGWEASRRDAEERKKKKSREKRPATESKTSKEARWPSGLERWLGLATGRSWPGSNPAAGTSLQNFGNPVYPALPVSFGGDNKKAVGPFYLVSMPVEVKDPTSPHWNV